MTEQSASTLRSFWGEIMAGEEPLREARFPLVNVQTAVAGHVIAHYLRPEHSVLDVGAGTGRFSLPLAAKGHRVTHLDLSSAMLELARKAAAEQHLSGIDFAEGDVTDLSAYGDASFDVTLCLDAPLSYAYPHQERALAEVCRVTAERVVLMVSSRSGVLPHMVDFDLSGELFPPGYDTSLDPFLLTRATLARGVEDYPPEVRDHLERTGNLTPPDYAFTPLELRRLLTEQGFVVELMGGPGALARSIRPENLAKVCADPALFEPFIELCLTFDLDPHNLGLGAVNLLAVARRAA